MTGVSESATTQLETLRRLVEAMSGELALAPLLTRIVASACELIGADDGTIGLYDSERDLIRTAAVHRMPERELGSEMPRGAGLAGQVLALGRPVRMRYGDLPSITLDELRENRVIGVPIFHLDELIGVFGIGRWNAQDYDDADVAALEVFARHAAIAIANAKRYEKERRRTARSELITRIASIIHGDLDRDLDALLSRAADAVHEVLDYPNVDIPLLDESDPQTLVIRARGGSYKTLIRHEDRIPIARGIMGAAVREGRTQLVNDVASDPRYVTPPGVIPPQAELAVPIRLGDAILGVINVEGDRRFDHHDASSLEIVADLLSIAIRNARLFATAQESAVLRERQRLARDLHDNVTQVLSSMSLLTQTLETAWERDPAEGRKRVKRLHELSQTAFAELRAMLRELQPPSAASPGAPSQSVPAAVHAVPSPLMISRRGMAMLGVEQLREHALPGALTRLLAAMVPESIRLQLDSDGYRPQQVARELVMLRLCQEAVSNSIRHARATTIWVGSTLDADEVVLTIADNGIGMPVGASPSGMGMASMAARVKDLGGILRVGGNEGGGTRIEARAPRLDREPAAR